jgi:hypothetical protein
MWINARITRLGDACRRLKTAPFQQLGLSNRIFATGFSTMTMLCRICTALRIPPVALFLIAILPADGIAQTCNPAIDGTYCAEQMRRTPSSSVTAPKSNPSLGGDFFSIVRDNDPATFGAITFGGGSKCIGILRRSSCN